MSDVNVEQLPHNLNWQKSRKNNATQTAVQLACAVHVLTGPNTSCIMFAKSELHETEEVKDFERLFRITVEYPVCMWSCSPKKFHSIIQLKFPPDKFGYKTVALQKNGSKMAAIRWQVQFSTQMWRCFALCWGMPIDNSRGVIICHRCLIPISCLGDPCTRTMSDASPVATTTT